MYVRQALLDKGSYLDVQVAAIGCHTVTLSLLQYYLVTCCRARRSCLSRCT